MIEVQHLSKRYGRVTAVDDVSFRVERGEILGFLGPNGAGKTTTMRILTGYMPASEGKATVAGFDVFDQPVEAKRRTGYLPETPPLYPDMSATVYFLPEGEAEPGSDDRRRVFSEAKAVVADEAKRYVWVLEAGNRVRRVEVTTGEEFFEEGDAETVEVIKELLATRVRPAVAMDGGDITFKGFKEGTVFLHMQGACSGCPSSTATLKSGIENLLRHFVPGVEAVQQV